MFKKCKIREAGNGFFIHSKSVPKNSNPVNSKRYCPLSEFVVVSRKNLAGNGFETGKAGEFQPGKIK
jgi:hypothetical protein